MTRIRVSIIAFIWLFSSLSMSAINYPADGSLQIYTQVPTHGLTVSSNGNLDVFGTISASDFEGNISSSWGLKRFYTFELMAPLEITNNAAIGLVIETGNITRVQAFSTNGTPANILFSIEAALTGGAKFTTTTDIQTISLSSAASVDSVGSNYLIPRGTFLRINLRSASPTILDFTIIIEVTKSQ